MDQVVSPNLNQLEGRIPDNIRNLKFLVIIALKSESNESFFFFFGTSNLTLTKIKNITLYDFKKFY